MDGAGQTVRVCTGLCCGMAGADELVRALPAMLGGVAGVVAVPCAGRCDDAPVVLAGYRAQPRASCESVMNAVVAQQMAGDGGEPEPCLVYLDYEGYRAEGGYSLLAAIAASDEVAEGALEALAASGVGHWSGRPLAQQLRDLRSGPPGCELALRVEGAAASNFRDRQLLERDPHRLLEGLLVAATLARASAVKVCLPEELGRCREMLEAELLELVENPPCEVPVISMPPGGAPAGALQYEALHWVRDILEKGPAWYLGFGRNGGHGLRAIAVSGRVVDPGVKLVPSGITIGQLIEEFCGGMAGGVAFLGAMADAGSGAVVVLGMTDHDRADSMGAFLRDASAALQ